MYRQNCPVVFAVSAHTRAIYVAIGCRWPECAVCRLNVFALANQLFYSAPSCMPSSITPLQVSSRRPSTVTWHELIPCAPAYEVCFVENPLCITIWRKVPTFQLSFSGQPGSGERQTCRWRHAYAELGACGLSAERRMGMAKKESRWAAVFLDVDIFWGDGALQTSTET